MKKHLLALFGLALFLAGCGSSGGVGTPPPSTPPPSSITLTVVDPEGKFNAAAYQVGTGNWQTLSMTGTPKTATIQMNNQTKYGVAVRCNTSEVTVIQATSTELKNPRIVCSSQTPSTVSFTVNVNISSDIQLGDGDQVCVNDSCQSAGVNNITLNLEPGTRDLLVTLRDSSGSVKVAKVVKGVNVAGGANTTVSLESGDVINQVSFTEPSPPSGYTMPFRGAFVGYMSANGTAMGWVNASPTSYRPVSGFGGGDLYEASIGASSSPNFNANPIAMVMSLQFFNSGAPSLAFPAPWPNGSLTMTQAAHPTVTGLTRNDSDLKGYGIVLEGNNQFKYTAVLSKGWLGSAGSYTLPDLSSSNLLGYTPLQNNSFASFRVTAVLSNKSVADLSNLLSNLLTNPSGFASGLAAGDYIKMAVASRNFTVGGGGNLTLP